MRDEPGTDELQLDELPPEYPPDRYQLTKNRVIRDRTTGRIVAHHPAGSNTSINEENSTDYLRLRREKYMLAQVAAAGGLARLTLDGDEYDTWSDIVANQADIALNKQDYVSVKSAEFVGKAAGFLLAERGELAMPASGGRLTMDLSQDVILAIADRLAARRREPENAENDE